MRQTLILLLTSVSLFRQVFAGCCEPLLEEGLSRPYLRNPCMGARTRTPQRLPGAHTRFFPESSGLTSEVTGSARQNYSSICNFNEA